MTNQTNFSSQPDDDCYPPIFLTCERINASVILIENIIVAMCLITHRAKFRKKEYWLQLVCLNINDIFSGLLMLLISHLRYSLKNRIIYCSVLWSLISINEMTFLYNVLGVCLYRLLFLLHSGRCRFGWKTKTTILQVIISVLLSTLYTGITFGLLTDTGIQIADCSIQELFRNNKKQSGTSVFFGFLFPLLCTDVLYSILLYKLHFILKRRQNYLEKANTDREKSGATKSHDTNSYKLLKSQNAESLYVERVLDQKQTQSSVTQPALVKQPASEEERNNLECLNVDNDNDYLNSEESNQEALYDNNLNDQLKKGSTTINDNVSIQNVDLSCCMKETVKPQKSSTEVETNPGSQSIAGQGQLDRTSRKAFNSSTNRSTCRASYVNRKILSREKTNRKRQQDNSQRLIYGGKCNDNQKQSIYLVGIVLLFINLSVFIPIIISLVSNFDPSFEISKMTRQILVLIVMNNALFDPWAYAFQSQEFRSALVENTTRLLTLVRK